MFKKSMTNTRSIGIFIVLVIFASVLVFAGPSGPCCQNTGGAAHSACQGRDYTQYKPASMVCCQPGTKKQYDPGAHDEYGGIVFGPGTCFGDSFTSRNPLGARKCAPPLGASLTCSKKCGAKCEIDADCGSNSVCDTQSCQCRKIVCPQGLRLCGTACVDIARDKTNCGRCGNVCSNDRMCKNKNCVACAAPDSKLCNGVCVDIRHDRHNCGDCNNQCPSGKICARRSCRNPPRYS